jgi:hypothetical protein
MKLSKLALLFVMALSTAFASHAAAEIVYTQVNTSLPINSYYNLDLNQDGIIDFTLRSSFREGLCQWGDQYSWALAVVPANDAWVVTSAGHIGPAYASALSAGVAVDNGQTYVGGFAVMADLYWGACGFGHDGPWLNAPDRYLGLQFRAADGRLHYGWAKVTTAAFVDQQGHLHAATMVFGFAYETIADQSIATGQTAD